MTERIASCSRGRTGSGGAVWRCIPVARFGLGSVEPKMTWTVEGASPSTTGGLREVGEAGVVAHHGRGLDRNGCGTPEGRGARRRWLPAISSSVSHSPGPAANTARSPRRSAEADGEASSLRSFPTQGAAEPSPRTVGERGCVPSGDARNRGRERPLLPPPLPIGHRSVRDDHPQRPPGRSRATAASRQGAPRAWAGVGETRRRRSWPQQDADISRVVWLVLESIHLRCPRGSADHRRAEASDRTIRGP